MPGAWYHSSWHGLLAFVFYYPLFMSFLWMLGAVVYHLRMERKETPPCPEDLQPLSVLIPCYNEGPHVEETLRYALARAFAYGQGPSAHCSVQNNRLGVARWMLIGVGQAAVYGLQAGLLWLMRSPRWPAVLDRAARGLGKTFWFGPFKIGFYGRSA